MTSGWDVVLIGGVLLVYAMFSRRLAGSVVTSAIVFVLAGLVLGTEGLDWFVAEIGSEDIRLLAEITLALVLFSDASALDSRRLVRETGVPVRLLSLALPLTIALGTVVAVVMFPDLVFFEAVVLAVLLAPTDAALGQTVVSDSRLPSALRQGLNVESGLNDGVCVPLLFGAVAFADLEEAPGFNGEILVDLIKEVTIAVAVGIGVAVVVASLLRASRQRGWLAEHWGQVVPLAATAMAYAGTVELGGSGFIGAFVCGLSYGRLLGATAHETTVLTEELGQMLSAVTFLMFGAVMIGRVTELDVQTLVYAILSLTVVRMVPVAISLVGSSATPQTMAFAGWFGPRGLATIVFTLTIIEESGLTGAEQIADVAIVTVALSVFAHGVTAPWLTDRYVRWLSNQSQPLGLEHEEIDVRVKTREFRRVDREPEPGAS